MWIAGLVLFGSGVLSVLVFSAVFFDLWRWIAGETATESFVASAGGGDKNASLYLITIAARTGATIVAKIVPRTFAMKYFDFCAMTVAVPQHRRSGSRGLTAVRRLLYPVGILRSDGSSDRRAHGERS